LVDAVGNPESDELDVSASEAAEVLSADDEAPSEGGAFWLDESLVQALVAREALVAQQATAMRRSPPYSN
jgi:hypothetical protein